MEGRREGDNLMVAQLPINHTTRCRTILYLSKNVSSLSHSFLLSLCPSLTLSLSLSHSLSLSLSHTLSLSLSLPPSLSLPGLLDLKL